MNKLKVVCFGPGPRFKGGIANFNTSLAKTFEKQGHEVHIVSWSQQYPAVIPREFKAKGNTTDFLENSSISIDYTLNYNNPLSWKKTANQISIYNPDIVVIQWSIALQGLPLQVMVKHLKKKSKARIIFDLHFVFQKEASKIDRLVAEPFLKLGDEYITHSHKTTKELLEFFPNQAFKLTTEGEGKRIFELYHPIYDIFEPQAGFDITAFKNKNGLKRHVFLFFGFIRRYKGLHNTIRAFHLLEQERDDVSLMICGESFWNTLDETKFSTKLKNGIFGVLKKIFLSSKNDEKAYRPLDLIDEFGVKNVAIFNHYIPNQDVHKYFQASDATVLFYDNSSPSGVESLSYNFLKPILATNVGHFPETINDGVNGYLAEAHNIESMKNKMEQLIEQPIAKQDIEKIVKKMSWKNYVNTLLNGQ